MSVRVEVVDGALTRELRRAVLRPDRAPGATLPGDELTDAVHVAALDSGGRVLGTCYVFPDACPWRPDRAPAWHLRQMATDPDHRGAGIGRAVLTGALRHATEAGGVLMWCNARETARVFYAGAGFRPYGSGYLDGPYRLPHIRMWMDLEPDSPATAS